MLASDFDYLLPPERIAQAPMKPRDHSRLLVMDRKTGEIEHKRFYEISEFLKPGDLLIVNESKVFKARLQGTVGATPASSLGSPSSNDPMVKAGLAPTATIELFLLRPDGDQWLALAKPGRKLVVDSTISFANGSTATVKEKHEDGTVSIDFQISPEEVFTLAEQIGEVPTPPYVEKPPADAVETYQTVYAKSVGSVAAPTAGFHFTPELIEKLKSQGIRFASVTLHVGLGTFRPMKTETLEEHVMHEEWLDVPSETRRLIEETKQNGGRVIAVGTTTVRALESGIDHGFTKLFITPGFEFKTIDGMITNFHLPKSTLLVLVSSFAGRSNVLNAYSTAIENEYRFYSFGDAMLIV